MNFGIIGVENFPENIKGVGVKGENGKIVVNQRSYISFSVVNSETPFNPRAFP